ncbi:MAG: DUF4832 domain-containing protein [Trueperaceae bacterium]
MFNALRYVVLFVFLLFLGACSEFGMKTDIAVNEDSILSVDEAVINPGEADVETIAAQGLPAEIYDANAYNDTAYLFLRNSDEIHWENLAAGTYNIYAWVRGQLYGDEAPKMTIAVGSQALTQSVESTTYQQIFFGTVTVDEGDRVTGRFINDAWGGTASTDRNLILSHIWCEPTTSSKPPPTAPEPAPTEPVPTSPDRGTETSVTINYAASNDVFPNPERGFFVQRSGWDRVLNPDWEDLSFETLQQARQNGYSLVRVYYMIPEFKGGSFSQEFLDTFATQLDHARQVGVKLIPLFSYSWPKDNDYANHPEQFENQDASVEDVTRHLDQLKPIIQENADVIAMWDGGFIGPWGEWHTSTNGLVGSTIGSEVNDKTRAVVNKLLEVVPSNRMITLRYSRHKQQLTGNTPLSEEEAYSGQARARLGAKNDCFLASKSNWGTYLPDDDVSVQAYKDFLHQDNLFLPQQGETCNVNEEAQPYISCDNALAELEYMRYSALNSDYHKDVLQGWKDGGCYETIAKRFGYRFELVRSSLPETVNKTQTLNASLDIKNVGFASPYNPRALEIILRNEQNGQVFPIVLNAGDLSVSNANHDPRFWKPNTTTTLNISVALPETIEPGRYEMLLSLPDPTSALRNRPEYAIRLANQDVWEENTGYNKLLHSLTINP